MPAHPANYYSDIRDPLSAAQELPKKLEALAHLCEHIRQECNRIRNTALANQMRYPPGLLACVAHLQIDIAQLRVELGYLSGKSGAELNDYIKMLQDPWAIISNAPNPS